MADSIGLGQWYRTLYSRTVDLVGDYAGEEMFIVEGDSLLLECFNDERLDFSSGFQLLHAVHIVETYLRSLHSRKCHFHIVFFDDHAHVSVPTKSTKSDRCKYALAREIVIQHLTQMLQFSASELEVKRFPSLQSDTFAKYLDATGAYFIMAHDGALQSKAHKEALRHMIHWVTVRGYTVALVNDIEFRDTKVMAMVVEGSARDAAAVKLPTLTNQAMAETNGSSIDFDDDLETLSASQKSQRRIITLAVLSALIENRDADTKPVFVFAMLLQLAIIENLHLLDRRTETVTPKKESSAFLEKFAATATKIFRSPAWASLLENSICDISDLVDGRIFFEVVQNFEESSQTPKAVKPVARAYKELYTSLEGLCGAKPKEDIEEESVTDATAEVKTLKPKHATLAVLPFRSPIFDAHLAPIEIVAEESNAPPINNTTDRVFAELTHWHNAKTPIDTKTIAPLTQWQKERGLRRNQLFMAEVQNYAASLTSAAGGILEPESIFVGADKADAKKTRGPQPVPVAAPSKDVKDTKKAGGGKKGGKNAKAVGQPSVKDNAALFHQQKLQKDMQKVQASWDFKRAEFENESKPSTRYIRAGVYLNSLKRDDRSVLEASIRVYQLACLWRSYVDPAQKAQQSAIAALMWNVIGGLVKIKQGITQDIADYVSKVTKALGLPDINLVVQGEETSKLTFAAPPDASPNVSVGLDAREFQLRHAGPYFDRNMGSAPDDRVKDFEPDAWQREVLDVIDAKRSLLVVAPTSAGKTFISFYAMRQVLEEDDEGVLVYVAPTKALVNQIAAEVHARFKKSTFKHGGAGRSVWGIHTRDYRINNPTGCQILVTVPHILQIMLMAPSNANSWSKRVKRIIFDEVHCIGQAEDGLVWEQLLLMAPCPIIALSATVGNPREFHNWLQSTQQANGMDVALVEHHHRYSDLRKYIYKPPQKFAFSGFSTQPPRLPLLGLDGVAGLAFMHPVSSIVNRSRGMPSDLTLEARDCWLLWKAMSKHATDNFPVGPELDPANALPGHIRKADVVAWEKSLKKVLNAWIHDYTSPFEAVIRELDQSIESVQKPKEQISQRVNTVASEFDTPAAHDVVATTLPLICTLHENDALPALFFNYDRTGCEDIALSLLNQFKKSESEWKESSPVWKKKLADFEIYKKKKEKAPKAAQKKKGKAQEGEEGQSKADSARDSAESDQNPFDSFDPEGMVEGFHLADIKAVASSELEIYRKQLIHRGIPEWLVECLERGIGVHHAGMNRKYRQICEMLFRKKYLRVVVATGTLALGINMPCKTVVFAGDSIFLTALNFRQAAGRAGRRGFDLLGNVIFQAVPYPKVCRLLSSRLPDLNGHFPITTTLVLRLFNLLHESKNATFAKNTINSILSQPRIYLGGDESRHAVLHHLRFSIEYLRRNYLLDGSGQPINFAGTVSHLYFTENSAFGFHALLKGGYFHALCKDFVKNTIKGDEILLKLMLVMSHLFGRRNLPTSQLENIRESVKGTTGSLVILPQLDEEASTALSEHNQQTLDIYKAYVNTYVSQHLGKTPDDFLPLTEVHCGGQERSAGSIHKNLPSVFANSPFAALSGFTDTDVNSIPQLCSTVRSGVFLEQAVIPHMIENAENLNAYLYDFYKHGSTADLARANGIRKGEVWFLLKDFSLVLATIVTSFRNYLKLSPLSDLEFLDITDAGDQQAEALEDRVEGIKAFAGAGSALPPAKAAGNAIVAQKAEHAAIIEAAKAATGKKKKVADSWDDDASDVSDWDDDAEEAEEKGKDTPSEADSDFRSEDAGFLKVLSAFAALQADFDKKFMDMWA